MMYLIPFEYYNWTDPAPTTSRNFPLATSTRFVITLVIEKTVFDWNKVNVAR